jgi:predicted SAM-dependent methyltransferase
MARRLHIGGEVAAPGWEILNVLPAPHVDHLGNANDLSRFPDGSFNDIYASHIVEHFDYKDEMLPALREWNRVMKPFGRLYISVPDLDVLAKLLLTKEQMTINERFHVMRMMFGGHVNTYDYHFAGLNEEFLRGYLEEAGFGAIKKVEEFGIFQDTSSMRFKGELISLNLVAKKMDMDKSLNAARAFVS